MFTLIGKMVRFIMLTLITMFTLLGMLVVINIIIAAQLLG